ncbi:hypothetical protein CVT24_010772 [Panaeolus cyanescens]|uniref:Uncharacterized protein n=1 Tax=Panaeolus cyanescens TaxID=181874 RepID=A0A409YYT5_9AGAR|nr:hypothetical protein CVT24_010772 [Panaeolus cyanescens]
MRAYHPLTAQQHSDSPDSPPAPSQATSNASAVSALRGRLNTISLQTPSSPSKAACSSGAAGIIATPSKGSSVSARPAPSVASSSTVNTSVDIDQMHVEFVNLKDIVLKLIKSNNKLKDDVSTLQHEVVQLTDECSSLKDEASSLQEALVQSQAENKDILECQTALVDIVSNIRSELDGIKKFIPQLNAESIILSPPAFDFKANRVYVVIQGRCPGVYSNLIWAKKMTDGLDVDNCAWQRVDGYHKAREFYENAERMNYIRFVDRNFPTDGPVYGPNVPFVPWRKS